MSYIKTSWVARVGTALNRFLKTNESSGSVELTNDPTGVTTAGTPFTVDNMNKIEQGIYDAHYPEFTEAATLTNIASGEVGTTLWGKVKKAIATIISWLDQDVRTTANPTFASVNTGQGATEVHLMNQNLRTIDNVSFANINPPVDNDDASMPSVGIGGFSYAVGSVDTIEAYPSITIGSGGTWVYFAHSIRSISSTNDRIEVGRIAGGSSVQGLLSAISGYPAQVYVIAWRIA